LEEAHRKRRFAVNKRPEGPKKKEEVPQVVDLPDGPAVRKPNQTLLKPLPPTQHDIDIEDEKHQMI
jgi:hypothetical protein